MPKIQRCPVTAGTSLLLVWMYVWSQLSLTQLACTTEGWRTAGWAAAIHLHPALEAKGGHNFGKRAPHEYSTAGSGSFQLLYFDNNSHDLWNASTLRVLGRSWQKRDESSSPFFFFFLSRWAWHTETFAEWGRVRLSESTSKGIFIVWS